jgi:hypothetical protein
VGKTLVLSKKAESYMYQLEVGAEGTPHLQGCFKFKNARSWSSIKDTFKWFVEPCHDWKASVKYCSKTDSRVEGPWAYNCEAGPEEYTFKLEKPYEWQQDIINICSGPVDPRKIYWIYCREGGSGKTALTKHLCMNNKAIFVSGKAADVKAAVASMPTKPPIVIFGVPRSAEKADGDQCVSWDAIETVKDGMFFSGKYESGMVLMAPPHMFIFANFPPDESKLSKDRWIIKNLGKDEDEIHFVPHAL